jgi:hypothetical protein
MADDKVRVLFCLLDGETRFFQIKTHIDENVLDMMDRIHTAKRVSLSDVDSNNLLLYKASSLEVNLTHS